MGLFVSLRYDLLNRYPFTVALQTARPYAFSSHRTTRDASHMMSVSRHSTLPFLLVPNASPSTRPTEYLLSFKHDSVSVLHCSALPAELSRNIHLG